MTGARPVDAVFFDLFGTLLSLAPLEDACERLAPGRGAEIAALWRRRQLEITWLRTAMDSWADLDVVTVDALRATVKELGVETEARGWSEIAGSFADLPIVDGASDALGRLRDAGVVTGVLTNASRATVDAVVRRRGLRFDHTLSVDAALRFKPHPAVYALATAATGLPAERIGFVTANGWDAAGASAFGFQVAWLRPQSSSVLPAVGAPEPRVVSWPDVPAVFLGEQTG